MRTGAIRKGLTLVAAAAVMVGLGACGEDELAGVGRFGTFISNPTAMNGSGVMAAATFVVTDEEFTAIVNATGLAPGQEHPQSVNAGDACPTPAADTDGDGLVDFQEGLPFYGPVLIPLDDDLADGAANTFPVGAVTEYQQSVGIKALMVTIPIDEQPLDLGTRTVVINGAFVLNGAIVPANTPGAEYVETLPVACGVIVQMD